MTTNSPNPVDGDVQALIADCEREIATLTDHIERMKRHHTPFDLSGYESQLKRQQLALVALTAEPVAYTDAEELETLRKGTFADMFTPHESYKADQLWIPLYTTPPAQLLRPVELPGFTYDAEGEPWIHGDEVVDLLMSLGYEVKS